MSTVVVEKTSEIKLINFTKNNEIIPANITNILSLGISNPIGGRPLKNNILTKIEAFFTDWLIYADKLKIDSFKKSEIRSLICLELKKLEKCISPNNY